MCDVLSELRAGLLCSARLRISGNFRWEQPVAVRGLLEAGACPGSWSVIVQIDTTERKGAAAEPN
jgi:hypothetical protein